MTTPGCANTNLGEPLSATQVYYILMTSTCHLGPLQEFPSHLQLGMDELVQLHSTHTDQGLINYRASRL